MEKIKISSRFDIEIDVTDEEEMLRITDYQTSTVTTLSREEVVNNLFIHLQQAMEETTRK